MSFSRLCRIDSKENNIWLTRKTFEMHVELEMTCSSAVNFEALSVSQLYGSTTVVMAIYGLH